MEPFLVLKQVSHLLQLLKMLQHHFAMMLQKCFVDYKLHLTVLCCESVKISTVFFIFA